MAVLVDRHALIASASTTNARAQVFLAPISKFSECQQLQHRDALPARLVASDNRDTTPQRLWTDS